jgi:hypothetical protein
MQVLGEESEGPVDLTDALAVLADLGARSGAPAIEEGNSVDFAVLNCPSNVRFYWCGKRLTTEMAMNAIAAGIRAALAAAVVDVSG